MTQQEFIDWLNKYLDQCEKDQVTLIKEKLALVNARSIGYNYFPSLDRDKTSIAGEKLSWSVDNVNGTYSTTIVDTFTDSDPQK